MIRGGCILPIMFILKELVTKHMKESGKAIKTNNPNVFLSVNILLILLYPVGHNALAQPDDRPNILFILVDDLGKEWISAYGAEGIETPHIDQLARTGLQFTNAYSTPQCTPSRLTLFTGQYPYRHGWVNHWDVPRWGGGAHFDWNMNPGLGQVMQNAGYRTAAAGKWQVNDFRAQPDAMVRHGFEDYCMWTGYETGVPASAERYWDPYLYTRDGSKTYKGKFGEDVFSDFLIQFMKDHRIDPMFLYYAMCLNPYSLYQYAPRARRDRKIRLPPGHGALHGPYGRQTGRSLRRTRVARKHHYCVYHRQRHRRKHHRYAKW